MINPILLGPGDLENFKLLEIMQEYNFSKANLELILVIVLNESRMVDSKDYRILLTDFKNILEGKRT